MKFRNAVICSLFISLSSCQQSNLSSFIVSSFGCSTKTVASLLILNPPTKTEYYEGERFNRSGLKLLAVFDDGTSFSPSNVDIELVEQGSLTLGMSKVHLRYLEKLVSVEIQVLPLELESLSISSYPITTTYVENGNYSFTGLKVVGKVKDTKEERELTEQEYSLSVMNTMIHEQDDILLSSGVYDVVISAYEKTASFPIRILHGYKIEAEDILYSASTSALGYVRVKNEEEEDYLSSPNRNGLIRPISDESASYASGNSYLGDIKSGNVISFFFESEDVIEANINIRASSCYMLSSDDWIPKRMGDEQVNRLFDAYLNQEKIEIPDDVVLPGGGKKDGNPDMALWVNWKNTTFSNIQTKKGLNEITLKIKSEYVNCLGYECSFNLDYLSVDFVS